MKYIDLRERTKEDILKIVMEKNIEIERLNKELEKYKYTADELNEIERLNNIINELEKWLKDYIKLFDKPDMLEEQTLEDLKEVLDKLQELKGE